MEQTIMTTEQSSWTLRTWLAFVLGKLCILLLQLAQWLRLPWGGTAFPGRVALKIDRNIVSVLRKRYRRFILVTGTNGKTSTTALLVKLLQSTGEQVVSNPEGANMIPGLVTALLKAESICQPASGNSDRNRLAVLEVDEGSLLPLSRLITEVDLVMVTNLFSDQLDRYGSVTALARRIKEAFAAWPEATLLLNADDPLVASFGHSHTCAYYYAVETSHSGPLTASRKLGDISLCPLCEQTLKFSSRSYAHLGHYTCPACNFSRPQVMFTGYPLPNQEQPGTKFLVRTPTGESEFYSNLTGLYSIYNIISALATTLVLQPETELSSLQPVVTAFQAPAGRTEHFIWPDRDKKGTLVLVKNPAGFNQALATLVNTTTLLVAINDLPADGRDISWLWETDIDALTDNISIICSGRRAADVAVCFKYHGLPPDKLTILPEPDKAVQAILTAPGQNFGILCNYTVLEPIRHALLQQGGNSYAA